MRIKCLAQGALLLLPATLNQRPHSWESVVLTTEPRQVLMDTPLPLILKTLYACTHDHLNYPKPPPIGCHSLVSHPCWAYIQNYSLPQWWFMLMPHSAIPAKTQSTDYRMISVIVWGIKSQVGAELREMALSRVSCRHPAPLPFVLSLKFWGVKLFSRVSRCLAG